MSDKASAVQYALRALGYDVRVDGIYGPKTAEAVSKAAAAGKSVITNMINALPDADAPANSLVITRPDLYELMCVVSEATDVPMSYLELCMVLENKWLSGGVVMELEGRFRGLGQHDKKTWDGLIKLGYKLPAFEQMDKESSLYATAYLYKENEKAFKARRRGTFFDEVAYLYHNQGAPNAYLYLTTASLRYPGQSPAAREVLVTARRRHVNESSNLA